MKKNVLLNESKVSKENKLLRLLAIIRKAMQEAKERNQRQDTEQE